MMNQSTTTKRYQRRTRLQWQQSINEFEQSDLSAQEFCDQHQLAYSSFSKWRSLLRQECRRESGFIDITPTKAEPVIVKHDWAVELAIGDNITLRIR